MGRVERLSTPRWVVIFPRGIPVELPPRGTLSAKSFPFRVGIDSRLNSSASSLGRDATRRARYLVRAIIIASSLSPPSRCAHQIVARARQRREDARRRCNRVQGCTAHSAAAFTTFLLTCRTRHRTAPHRALRTVGPVWRCVLQKCNQAGNLFRRTAKRGIFCREKQLMPRLAQPRDSREH